MYLKPVFDDDGITTANTRLQDAEHLTYDTRYPVVLLKNNLGDKIDCYHEKGDHAAVTNHTVYLLLARFWLLPGREKVRECQKECNKCREKEVQISRTNYGTTTKISIERTTSADNCSR